MSHDVTIEIVARKVYQVEVDEDFDFSDWSTLYNLVVEHESNGHHYEEWEEITVTDNDEDYTYYL